MTSVQVEDCGRVRVLTLVSDDGLNVLDDTSRKRLSAALEGADQTSTVRAVAICGSERAFCVGADIKEFPRAPTDPSQFLFDALAVFSQPERLTKPVVCVTAGAAIAGGMELALASDWIFAEPTATFALTEARFGMIPGYALSRLALHVGAARARRLLMTGETLNPESAIATGLPVTASGPGCALADALDFCRGTMLSSPASIAEIKRRTTHSGRDNDFAETIAAYSLLWNQDDAIEGIRGFREGRTPRFADED